MDNGSTRLNSTVDAQWQGPPGPQLLLELEPARRVFFSNLVDFLLRRQVPQMDLVCRPGSFWRDVFVPQGMPWWSFLESVLWHATTVLIVLITFRASGPTIRVAEPQVDRSSVTYYRRNPTYPALGGRAPRVPIRTERKLEAEHAMQVVREAMRRPGSLVAPPDIAEVTKPTGLPKSIGETPITPAMPLAATSGLQRKGPQMGVSAVAPPPEIKQTAGFRSSGLQVDVVAPAPTVGIGAKRAGSRGSGGFQTVAVAPAPELTAVSGRHGVTGPKVGAIAPPPAVQGGALGRTGKGGDGNLLQVEVVAPAPDLPLEAQGGAGGTAQAGLGGAGAGVGVVPPPPSVQGSSVGGSGRRGGGGGSLGSGLGAVPPAPSMAGVGRLGGPGGPGGGLAPGRSGLGGGSGAAVVPPPPSVGGVGGAGGAGGRSGFGAGSGPGGSGVAAVPPAPSLGGAGRLIGPGGGLAPGSGGIAGGSGGGVVPPPPSVSGVGGRSGFGGGGGTNGNGLGGSGMGAVPPAPSVGSGGRYGSGGGGLSGSVAGVPPAPSLDGAGGTGGRSNGNGLGDSGSEVVPPPPSLDAIGEPNTDQGLNSTVEELPLRIVGLAFALPGTSFSSSYEVFIAQKDLGGSRVQLIKLVYWFLPYQRRLSEYHPDASKMYKLRVTRDQACDESLAHMAVSPTGQVYEGSHLPADELPTSPERLNVVLPCYRTTADDYRKAIGRVR